MPTNIEIKARVDDRDALAPIAAELADHGPELLLQDDTFFRCGNGRLKLRAFPSGQGELIFYRRADASGPRPSYYQIVPTAEPDKLREALAAAYGEAGRVRKARLLYLVGRTRVHLDRVEGLGDFLELEVVMRDGEAAEQGVAEAHALLDRLGIAASRLVPAAYVDLLRGAD